MTACTGRSSGRPLQYVAVLFETREIKEDNHRTEMSDRFELVSIDQAKDEWCSYRNPGLPVLW